MLSNEEREALEILNNTEWDGFMITIKNLIEKQSKEIEENKKYLVNLTHEQYIKLVEQIRSEINKEWKDVIKAKIEEYKKQIEKMEKDDIGRGFTLGKEWSDLKAKVEFGQSLLEKE